MNTSDSVSEIAKALVAFQAENIIISHNSKAGQQGRRRWSYASLDNILECIRPSLSKHGLVILQSMSAPMTLTTMVLHISGEFISSSLNLQDTLDATIQENEGRGVSPAQSLGMVITYARRYNMSILGIATDEDLDGELVNQKNAAPPPKATPDKPVSRGTMIKTCNDLGSTFYLDHWNDDPETGAKPVMAKRFSEDRVDTFSKLKTEELIKLGVWLEMVVEQFGDYLTMREAKKHADEE